MLIVAAIGGGALLRPGEPFDAETQRRNVKIACKAVAELAQDNHVVVTHGNGPQVGRLALQSAAYRDARSYPLDVDGRPVRSQVAALTMREAIDRLEARLRHRLAHLADRARSRQLRHREAGPGEWRHGDPPTHGPKYSDLPPEERQLVRHKTFVLAAETPNEASSDLELLDHDFLLFRNADTVEDNVIHRRPSDGYTLIEPTKHADQLENCVAPVTSSPRVPGRMSLAAATGLLDLGAEPFVFFMDSRTGRGNVVYRRYDGHYGLVAPATGPEAQTS